MSISLSAKLLAERLNKEFPESVAEVGENHLLLNASALTDVAIFLKKTAELEFDYLANLTAVDYKEYFEVVYHLVSIGRNHRLTLKVRCTDREKPEVPSLYSVWRGADLQEREIFDLFGINFTGHPNMKRIFLWEGFPGYPLRKDFENAS